MRRLAAVVLLVWGCSESAGLGAEPAVRDSAGVRIVEHAGLGSGGWQLGEEPSFSIGNVDAAEEYQFHMVVGALALSDGRVVVANAGTQDLRWYTPAGVHVRSSGRAGEGPGEFRMLAGLGLLPGDTVVAYDADLRRVSLFGPDGDFVRSAPLEREGHPGMDHPVFAGVMGDNSLLMVGRVFDPRSLRDGPISMPMPAYRYGVDGSELDSLGTFHGWEASVVTGRHDQVVSMQIRDRPFGRSTSLVTVEDGFVAATPLTYAFERYDVTGALRTSVRLDRPNAPVTDADVAWYREQVLTELEDDTMRRQREAEFETLDFPDTKPAYAVPILADRSGNVWVREYPDGSGGPDRWNVFAPDGRWVGAVATPADLQLTDIGADYVLGVWRDELDVQHVQKYVLTSGE